MLCQFQEYSTVIQVYVCMFLFMGFSLQAITRYGMWFPVLCSRTLWWCLSVLHTVVCVSIVYFKMFSRITPSSALGSGLETDCLLSD